MSSRLFLQVLGVVAVGVVPLVVMFRLTAPTKCGDRAVDRAGSGSIFDDDDTERHCQSVLDKLTGTGP